MVLNEMDLKDWQSKVDDLSKWKAELKEKKEMFDLENEGLIKNITALNETIMQTKQEFEVLAEEEYNKTGQKKLLGGIGIQDRTFLDYKPEDAFNWAKEHGLCLSLDKKAFEAVAKTQKLDFVTEDTKTKVTFPPKIKL